MYAPLFCIVVLTTPSRSERLRRYCNVHDCRPILSIIHANYAIIAKAIGKLEERDTPLTTALRLLHDCTERVVSLPSQNAAKAKAKCEAVFLKNKGLQTLNLISKVLSGEQLSATEQASIQAYSPVELSHFRFCPITSCEVESTFSRYEAVMRANRCSFHFEHLKWHFVSQCNFN